LAGKDLRRALHRPSPGTVDIGVKVEVRNEIMETVNAVLLRNQTHRYPKPFKKQGSAPSSRIRAAFVSPGKL
jgi:uncharacterized FAD-dependent dehydrogenase